MDNVQRKICHIMHYDRLESLIASKTLLCDAHIHGLPHGGTTIGLDTIKERRLTLPVPCHEGLHVGDCVPFYFSPRSVMLYVISKQNHKGLAYQGGQRPILHFVFDLAAIIEWASANNKRWAFTDINAGSRIFNVLTGASYNQTSGLTAVMKNRLNSCLKTVVQYH